VRDALEYMGSDPSDRLRDAWGEEEERDEAVHGVTSDGVHPLATGGPCRCDACRGRTDAPALCRSEHPDGGARCHRRPGHPGRCCQFIDDTLLEWEGPS
jgi:hypothetical protein